MSWNFEQSRERLLAEKSRLQSSGISVTKLTREMSLSNLSPADVKLAHGVHLYSSILNWPEIVADSAMKKDDYRRVHRSLHVLSIEQRHILQQLVDGEKIQVQGPKFHGLLYKPYDDDSGLAKRALMAALACAQASKGLAHVFPDYPSLVPSIGLDIGDSLLASIGVRGDRELISIGAPANIAAKILGGNNVITVSTQFHSALRRKFAGLFIPDGELFKLYCSEIENLDEMLAEEIGWTLRGAIRRMEESRDAMPLSDISVADALQRIDPYSLGPRTIKRLAASSFFADIDGYTALVDSLKNDSQGLKRAVELLHLFRYELRQVVENDFDGIVVQHQGDRLQCVLHTPCGDEDEIRRQAVEVCIGLNSSVEEVLNKELSLVTKLHIAVGCDFGKTIVSRLGVKGDLDTVAIGESVIQAERIQFACAGRELGISAKVFSSLTDAAVAKAFSFDSARGFYVAKNVTNVSLEEADLSKAYAAGVGVGYGSNRTISISANTDLNETPRPLKVTRPWAPGK